MIELLEEEEERELNPLCIDLQQKRMCADTPVRLHMFAKWTYIYAVKNGYHSHIVILVHTALSTLPPTWEISPLHKEHKRNFLDMVTCKSV